MSERASLPEGARCGVHPEVDARFTCARCGTFGCAGCRFGGEPPEGVTNRVAVCRACAEGGLDEPVPWERRKELGLWRAFRETVRAASREPRRFHRTPSIEKGPAGALMFGLAAFGAGNLGLLLTIVLMIMLGGGAAGVALREPVVAAVGVGYGCLVIGMIPLSIGQVVLQALIGILVATAGAHGTLALSKKTGARFEDTLRAVSYAYAPYVWTYWIPGCGVYVAYFWALAVEWIGVRETHRIGNDATALAVLGYRLLFLLLLLGIYAALIALFFVYAPGPRPGGGGWPPTPPVVAPGAE